MTAVTVLAAIGGLISAGLALVVALQRRDAKGAAFVVMCSLIALWNAYYVLLGILPCNAATWWLLRGPAVAANVLPTAILYFSVLSTEARPAVWRWLARFSVLIALVLVVANPFGLVVRELQPQPWGCSSVPGPLYHLFTLNLLLCFTAAFALCVHDVRKARDARDRLLARYWLLSAAVGLPLGITNVLPVYGVPIYPLGNLGSVVWASVVAYAMVRHRLFDVEILAPRIGAAFGAGLLTVVPAYATLVLLQIYFWGSAHLQLSFAVLVALVAVLAAFPALRRWLEREFSKRAFPHKAEQRASLAIVSRAVFQEKDRERLLRLVVAGLRGVFSPTTVAIFTRRPEAGEVRLAHHEGRDPVDKVFPITGALVAELEEASLSLLQSELRESKQPRAREVGEILTRNLWTVCVPMKTHHHLVGFLALGLKGGRDWYTSADLEALERLADEIALALENVYLQEQSALARQALERVERLSAIGTMVAGIVHEVRNPLAAFSTFMQVATERKGDPALMEQSSLVIKAEIDRVQRLLDELLEATRGKTFEFQEVDLVAAVTQVADLLKPQAKQARVELQVEAPADLPTVFADPDRVRQVLFNLGMNAIEASNEGSVVAFAIARAEKGGRRYAEVCVRDSGRGVPWEMRERIFQPFFTTKPKGTGLGLAICLQIVEEHQGYIEIRDHEGPGATFAVGIPEFIAEVHGTLVGRQEEQLKLTPEEEQHIRSLIGNIELPPEVLRLARRMRPKR